MINKRLLMAGMISSAALIAGCNQGETEKTTELKLDTLEQKVNYTIAADVASNFKQREIPIDVDAFTAALTDVRDGAGPEDMRMTPEQMRETMQTFQEQQMELAQQKQKELAETNRTEGETFLAANAEKEGVMVTDSGLQYKVIEAGDGIKPAAEDTVTVHYTGKLIDGSVFDTSEERGPATFGLNQVIAGWTEGLQLMETGSKYELYIPADLAYGPGGNQGIPPNSTLIFEVELLEVEAADAPADAAGEEAAE